MCTPRGRDVLAAACQAGALRLEPALPDVLWAARTGQKKARGALWGLRLALRILGLPVPRQIGLRTFAFWLTELPIAGKLRSILGTVRRIRRPCLYLRHAAWASALRAEWRVVVGTAEHVS